MEDMYEEYDDYEGEEIGEESVVYDNSPFDSRTTAKTVYEQCMEPTIYGALDQIIWLLFACLLFRICTQLGMNSNYCNFIEEFSSFVNEVLTFSFLVSIPKPLCHIISFVSGISSLFSVIGPNAMYTSILAMATYWCLVACSKKSFSSNTYQIIVGSLLTYLVARYLFSNCFMIMQVSSDFRKLIITTNCTCCREYYEFLPEAWEQVRGVQMIMIMKTLSLSYEIWTGFRKELPPVLDFLGYLFCPGTVLFGPWISFHAYSKVFEGRRWV